MRLGELSPAPGSKTKKFRKGRGHGSGNGKTAGRGHKGQKARSGYSSREGFEGGQFPLYRRLPKRGFNCRNSKEIVTVNLYLLNVFEDGAVVDISALKSKGLISSPKDGVKILAKGKLNRKLTVRANAFSESASAAIETAGGKAEVI